jgi:hypothetical protein
MKKFTQILIVGVFCSLVSGAVFASSFTIDNLNLREQFPQQDYPATYFKIGLEETWNKINGAQNLL